MGKFRFLFAEELKELVWNLRFWILVLVAFGLCMFIPVASYGKITTCFDILFFVPKEEILSEKSGFTFLSVMGELRSGAFGMLAPLLAGLAVLPVVCGEQESGLFRLILIRCGKVKTILGKLCASLLGGGLVITLGYFLAGLVMVSRIPHGEAALEADLTQNGFYWLPRSVTQLPGPVVTAIFFLELTAGVLFYGMVCALWTYLLSAVIQNRYVLSCIPYMGIWLVARWSDAALLRIGEENVMVRFFLAVEPGSVMTFLQHTREGLVQIIFYTLLSALSVWIQLMALNNRKDCGG